MPKMSPRNIVITGASAGVGRATARTFAARHCRVALIARDETRLQAAAREVETAGGQALTLPLDVALAERVFAAADEVAARWGTIDVWINCAMATVFAPFADLSPEEFRRVTEVTYLGQVHGTMAALKHMRRRDHGTIVQVGSALSYRAIPLQSAYCGAKFAIRGFTDALRSELAHDRSRVRLTMVQLPAVNTPQFDWARNRLPREVQPVPPIFEPEAIAQEIVRASIEAPRELWIGRSSLKAILGTMLVPGVADRVLAREGYSGQITSAPKPADKADNLFAPVSGDYGARGRFSERAEDKVYGVSETTFRVALACAGAAVLITALSWGRNSLREVAAGIRERMIAHG